MTTATANKVKAPKKGFKLDRQMIPTLAAVVIFILMIIMGQALFGTYIRLGFISSPVSYTHLTLPTICSV